MVAFSASSSDFRLRLLAMKGSMGGWGNSFFSASLLRLNIVLSVTSCSSNLVFFCFILVFELGLQ